MKREAWIAGLLAVLAVLAAIAAWVGESRRDDREPGAFPGGGDAAWIKSHAPNDAAPQARSSSELAVASPEYADALAGRATPASHVAAASMMAAAAVGADTPKITIKDTYQTVEATLGQTVTYRCFQNPLPSVDTIPPKESADWTVTRGTQRIELATLRLSPDKYGEYVFTLKNNETKPTKVIFIEPHTANPFQLVFNRAYRGKFSIPTPVPSSTGPALQVIGADPYIRLEGSGIARAAKIEIYLLDKSNPAKPVQRIDNKFLVKMSGGIPGAFSIEGKVDAAPSAFDLVFRQVENSGHSVETVVPFQKADIGVGLVPSILSPDTKSESFGRGNVDLTLKEITDSREDLHATIEFAGVDDSVLKSVSVISGSVTKLTFSLPDGKSRVTASYRRGNQVLGTSEPVAFDIRNRPLTVTRVEPLDFGTSPGHRLIKVVFDPNAPLSSQAQTPADLKAFFQIERSGGTGDFDRGLGATLDPTRDGYSLEYDKLNNTVLIKFNQDVVADVYRLTVKSRLTDVYGNPLEGVPGQAGSDFRIILGQQASMAEALDPRGIINTTGQYVPYQEFTKPRNQANGFNPSDKVVTRVARLYYYRDAHRVAQIINRKVKSYNRTGVDSARQLADRARQVADQKAAIRQQTERDAIEKARKTRTKEAELRHAENSLNRTLDLVAAAQTAPVASEADAKSARNAEVAALDASARSFAAQVERLSTEVQSLRDAENTANDLVQRAESEERLSREDQFRREVAAAKADPDTYAEGKPDSDDPVEQVSVSVIGEGLIQMRGPIKGVNLIRMMIDQIDAPVGQVRVAVHTVQLNGERADRMEEVADTTQKQIDQARFLTLQSSELLRRAIVEVAAARADESRVQFAGDAQKDRDQRYLYSFFGRDFIDELRTIDSEFLKSGNKLLSLHSMDTTSLSSALMLMSLARNDTRRQILGQFEAFCQAELPRAEQSYMEQGIVCPPKKHTLLKRHHPAFVSLAGNARFESLRGFYGAEIGHQDTMTPLQREFIRLAQIFKSRLVIEMEYRQRVAERAIIEERHTNLEEQYQEVAVLEREALNELRQTESERRQRHEVFRTLAAQIEGLAKTVAKGPEENREDVVAMKKALEGLVLTAAVKGGERSPPTFGTVTLPKQRAQFMVCLPSVVISRPIDVEAIAKHIVIVKDDEVKYSDTCNTLLSECRQSMDELKVYSCVRDYGFDDLMEHLHNIEEIYGAKGFTPYAFAIEMEKFERGMKRIVDRIGQIGEKLVDEYRDIIRSVKPGDPDTVSAAAARLHRLRGEVLSQIDSKSPQGVTLRTSFDEMKIAIDKLLELETRVAAAQKRAKDARHPLEHKKFLDMLIDEVEDKYIELLEGTRAHTANIDNYIKRLTTALDDDFNTQFYLPTFRMVRQTSAERYYNVQFGQIETTSILANNRAFAKVSPAASMEFDLPKRDILISEAINGAKALVNDVGALANDPTFLAAAQLKSGQSGATPGRGTTGGYSVVRSVLPGLDSSTAEHVISQNANGGQQFGSNLENLIPDPAIYKFETGTGYEIRPVIQPDGQAVVFGFHYLYTTQVREPVRADEKHLGRVKRHHIDTDVQLSNFELREVSRYIVALKASRTARGVPLFEDIPIAGALFRPAPSDESSLQQNVVLAQATIFPTLFDLMGLRWAPVLATLGPGQVRKDQTMIRDRYHELREAVIHLGSEKVDEQLRLEELREEGRLSPRKPRPESIPPGYPTPDLEHPHDGEAIPVPDSTNYGQANPGASMMSRGAPVVDESMPLTPATNYQEPGPAPRPAPVEPNPGGASLRRVPQGDEPRYEQTQYQESDYQGAQIRGPQSPVSQAVPGYPPVRLQGAPAVPVGLPRPRVR